MDDNTLTPSSLSYDEYFTTTLAILSVAGTRYLPRDVPVLNATHLQVAVSLLALLSYIRVVVLNVLFKLLYSH